MSSTPFVEYQPSRATSGPLVEIVDVSERPFAVVSLHTAEQQRLRFRRVHVLFFDTADRLLLTRIPSENSRKGPVWDLPAQGPVLAGEAREDAVRRLLWDRLRIRSPRIARLPEAPRSVSTLAAVFRADAVQERPQPTFDAESLYADSDELAALAESFSELLSPPLLRLLEQHLLPSTRAFRGTFRY